MPCKTKPVPVMPERIERLAPAEAQHVVEVAYPTKSGPMLFKLKNGQLRANYAHGTIFMTASVMRGVCRLLDINYSRLVAERDRLREAEASRQLQRDVSDAVALLGRHGYTVTKKRSAK